MSQSPTRPSAHQPLFDRIPTTLQERPGWVCWSCEFRDGKWTKVPVDPKTGLNASCTDPSTWSDFRTARSRYEVGGVDGVGIVLGDGLTGLDLDHHRDPESGTITPLAMAIISKLGSYTEVSPSGCGIHTLLLGKKPGQRCRRNQGVEIYDHDRFLTVTGHRLVNTPLLAYAPEVVEDRQAEIDALYHKLFPAEEALVPTPASTPQKDPDGQEQRDALSDEDIIALAGRARNGRKFTALWEGHWGDAGYPSASEADLALCSILAFYIGAKAERIDQLFRRSGLFRDKWDENRGEDTYGAKTIKECLKGARRFYSSSTGRTFISLIAQRPKVRVEFPLWTPALDDMTREAWKTLCDANDPPFLFRSAATPAWIRSEDDGTPFVQDVDQDRLRYILMEIAGWYLWKKVEEEWEWVRVSLPAQLLKNMLACPDIQLPILAGIVQAPVFSVDGQLQTTPGYSPATKTFFDASSGVEVPPVSEQPTGEEIAEARRLILEDVLGDFPFVGEPERAHTVAMIILPFARELIPGPTPLHLIEKPSPGTGATLLAEIPGIVFTGRATPAMTEGQDDEEWRKRIFAKFRKGSPIIFIDNLGRKLDSSSLSSALTAWPHWEDRVLGVSEMMRVPVRAMWIASGNNPAVSNEVSRRTARIRLDAKTDQPWLRDKFRHKDLRAWVRENRGKLIWACLILIRAWIVAGKPMGGQVLGMFEDWARVMGGILQVAGIPGFMGNLAEFYAASDEEAAAWRRFLAAWWDKHKDQGVGVKDLHGIALDCDGLDLGDKGEQSQKSRLGKLLSQLRDRQFKVDLVDGEPPLQLQVSRAGTSKRAVNWRLLGVRVVSLGEVLPQNENSLGNADQGVRPDQTQKPPDDTHPPSPTRVVAPEIKFDAEEHPHPPSPPSPEETEPGLDCPGCGRRLFMVGGALLPCHFCPPEDPDMEEGKV